jgi:hypothetical protein
MADKYINELTELSGTPGGSLVLPIMDTATKHITVANLMAAGLQLGTASTQAAPGTHLHAGVYAGTALAGTAAAGLAPALSGVSTEYLNGEGNWSTPAGGTAGGAPTDAQYVTLALNSTLTGERVLAGGTAVTLVDAGAGGNVTVNVELGTAATNAAPGTHLHTATYAPISSQFLTWGSGDATLTGEARLQAGTAVTITGAVANGTATLSVDLGTASTQAAAGNHNHTGVYTTTTVATDPIFDAAGDLVAGTAADKSARVAIGGTAGMKLVVAPAQAAKIAWIPDRFTAGFLIGDALGTVAATNATYGPIEMPFAGTITAARVVSDANGTVSITFRKQNYAGYVTAPGTATDISGTLPLVLAGTCKAELTTLTSWTPGFSAGDLLHAVVAAAGTVKELRVSLTGYKADVA